MVSVTHLILRFAIVQNKFQQTNKTEINHIIDNHIKFEVSLHFWRIWPTVRQQRFIVHGKTATIVFLWLKSQYEKMPIDITHVICYAYTVIA